MAIKCRIYFSKNEVEYSAEAYNTYHQAFIFYEPLHIPL